MTSVFPEYQLSEAESPIALFVFAHGAGADMDSDFMLDFTKRLVEQGISVLRFNFNYMTRRKLEGKKFPPERMPKLIDCFEQVLQLEEVTNSNLPLVIGGKSMGSRVAVTILNDTKALACICLGYPFHPQKQPEKLRLEPLQQAQKPVYIMQGERDALGSKAEVAGYDMSACCELTFFEDGDHNLKPRVRSGHTLDEHLQSASQILADKLTLMIGEEDAK